MTNHTFHPQTLDPRSAGKVTRYHTWERVRDQSVGEHTWQVMRILLAIHPHASPELMRHAMFHDVGERAVGDVPYPVKRENPELKVAFDALEQSATLQMTPWGVMAGVLLTDEERNLFKLAEFIEMYEWGCDEVALGNKNAVLVRDRCLVQALTMTDQVSAGVRKSALEYIARRQKHEEKYRT